MLRHGLSTYDFSRAANIAFVQAAGDILREQGKTPSFSRVSTITGLHRHVVSDIVNSGASDPAALGPSKDYQRNRLARVLAGWFEGPDYTDPDGRPLDLPVEGPAPSFESLVRSYSGDIYPAIILDEALRVGAVRRLKDGSLRAVSRRYTLGGAEPEAIAYLGEAARDLLGTLEYNLSSTADARRYEDTAVSVELDRAAIPLFRRMLRERGAAFLEDVEGWISEHESREPSRAIRAGVRIQMVVDDEAESATPGIQPKD